MTQDQFINIANSANPYVETCYGLTRLFTVKHRDGRLHIWIEYINEWECTTQERTYIGRFNELICN